MGPGSIHTIPRSRPRFRVGPRPSDFVLCLSPVLCSHLVALSSFLYVQSTYLRIQRRVHVVKGPLYKLDTKVSGYLEEAYSVTRTVEHLPRDMFPIGHLFFDVFYWKVGSFLVVLGICTWNNWTKWVDCKELMCVTWSVKKFKSENSKVSLRLSDLYIKTSRRNLNVDKNWWI